MSEFESQPPDIFRVSYDQIGDIVRNIKRSNTDHKQVIADIEANHPTLLVMIALQTEQYRDAPHYTQSSEEGFTNGVGLAYEHFKKISEHFGVPVPPDSHQPLRLEHMIRANQTIQSGNVNVRDFNSILSVFSSIPEFQKTMPGWHEASARTAGRIIRMPYTELMDLESTAAAIAIATSRPSSGPLDLRPVEFAFEFINGYGRALLMMEALKTSSELPDL